MKNCWIDEDVIGMEEITIHMCLNIPVEKQAEWVAKLRKSLRESKLGTKKCPGE